MSDYWSKKLRNPAAPAKTDVAAEVPAQPVRQPVANNGPTTPPRIYVSQDRPTGAGYLMLGCLLLLVAALDNRHGSRLALLLAMLAVLVSGAIVIWRADLDAFRRVELIGDDSLVLVGKRRRFQAALSELVRVDTSSSRIAQLFGWDELSFHFPTGIGRVRRVDDAGDLVWQLQQSRPSLDSDIRSVMRPWVVNVAGLTICLNAAFGAVYLLASRTDAVTTGQIAFSLGIDCAAFLCGLCLLSSSHAAWIVLVVLSFLAFGVALTDEHVSAVTLGNIVVWLMVLFAPGLRRWAPSGG